MSYLNGQTGYREDLLNTRSVVKMGSYAVIEPDGIVKNAIPGYENCDVTILGSPAMGATFADYLITVHEITVKNADEEATLTEGGYIYSPVSNTIAIKNAGKEDAKLFAYKRRYEAVEGYSAHTVVANINDTPWMPYEGMENCHSKDFLPAAGDFGFDMNMHLLKFKLGGSHGYIETHIQQHGMYFLQGKAMYRIGDDWIPLKKGDYVFMDCYCPQACYGVGKDEDLIYIYSKDCNRDVQLYAVPEQTIP